MGSVLSLSLSLSVCVSRLSLSRSRVQREKQTSNSSSNNNNNGNNTKRERVTTKELVFSDVCLFENFFRNPPKGDTRSTLSIIIALLPRFCASSSLPPLKEERVSEAYSSSLRAGVLYPFIKSSGNICESSAQQAVRGFDYVADISV